MAALRCAVIVRVFVRTLIRAQMVRRVGTIGASRRFVAGQTVFDAQTVKIVWMTPRMTASLMARTSVLAFAFFVHVRPLSRLGSVNVSAVVSSSFLKAAKHQRVIVKRYAVVCFAASMRSVSMTNVSSSAATLARAWCARATSSVRMASACDQVVTHARAWIAV